MAPKSSPEPDFDRELADLPPELRWRKMEGPGRGGAVRRAEARDPEKSLPVSSGAIAPSSSCSTTCARICTGGRSSSSGQGRALRCTPAPPSGRQLRAAFGIPADAKQLTKLEAGMLMAVAMFASHPGGDFGDVRPEISRDLIAELTRGGADRRRAPQPETRRALAYVTTEKFLFQFGFESLRGSCRTWQNSRTRDFSVGRAGMSPASGVCPGKRDGRSAPLTRRAVLPISQAYLDFRPKRTSRRRMRLEAISRRPKRFALGLAGLSNSI